MLLSINNLSIQHVATLSLHLNKGEILFIQGKSGSGKTLLLRAIADLDPNQGQVLLHGKNRDTFPAHQWRKQVGMLPATPMWWDERISDCVTTTRDLLKEFHLRENIGDEPVDIISSGENQRLALIRLLNNQPDVLLLDEPTANLDDANTQHVEHAIQRYIRQTQAGVIWVSHDIQQAKRMADRTLILDHGELRNTT
jgi:ABC-type iron transport system FetAB ATPase subunit